MKITTSLLGLFVCMCGLAVGADRPTLVCNRDAIGAQERPRYNDLLHKLRTSVHDRRELPDGYSFRLGEQSISLTEVAEWIRMERQCCPFLVFQIDVPAGNAEVQLTLRGPSGTKAILASEFAK